MCRQKKNRKKLNWKYITDFRLSTYNKLIQSALYTPNSTYTYIRAEAFQYSEYSDFFWSYNWLVNFKERLRKFSFNFSMATTCFLKKKKNFLNTLRCMCEKWVIGWQNISNFSGSDGWQFPLINEKRMAFGPFDLNFFFGSLLVSFLFKN